MTDFTDSQKKAITEEKDNIIVSASAGSGKTTVMIERLVNELCKKDPVCGKYATSLDNILAVTFTIEAAASMKGKLRELMVQRIHDPSTPDEDSERLKEQLELIPAADISTIDAFCAHLVRRYFYLAGCDASFEILADDTAAGEMQMYALDRLLDKRYAEQDEDFKRLLKYYGGKQSDTSLREIITSVYKQARSTFNYRGVIKDTDKIYTEEGFAKVVRELLSMSDDYRYMLNSHGEIFTQQECVNNLRPACVELQSLIKEIDEYRKNFSCPDTNALESAAAVSDEVRKNLSVLVQKCDDSENPSANGRSYSAKFPAKLYKAKKPDARSKGPGKEFSKAFNEFIDKTIQIRYEVIRKNTDITNAGKCLDKHIDFFDSGKTAVAFANLLLDYDNEYSAVKKERNMLDYSDLEYFALDLLSNNNVQKDIAGKYRLVFVDEYQDINPVQDKIISKIGGRKFYVGDVKQAIYGFRGSRSTFFSKQEKDFASSDDGCAITMNDNFRSAHEIIDAVNSIFSASMTEGIYDTDYKGKPAGADAGSGAAHNGSPTDAGANLEGMPAGTDVCQDVTQDGKSNSTDTAGGAEMIARGRYPDYTEYKGDASHCIHGVAELFIYGNCNGNEKEEIGDKPYSVRDDDPRKNVSREGLAAVQIVRECLGKYRYDINRKDWVETRPGDICILVRTRSSIDTYVHALAKAGYPVTAEDNDDICSTPEVQQMLDILSYIDNKSQDIPLVSALLSPLGDFTDEGLGAFTEDDLAVIRVAYGHGKAFYKACGWYKNAKECKVPRKPDKDSASKYSSDGHIEHEWENDIRSIDLYSETIQKRLKLFYNRMCGLRQDASVMKAGALMDKIIRTYGFAASYPKDGGEIMRYMRRLIREGMDLNLTAFLKRIKNSSKIAAPASAPSDSIRVMTMHGSKGLEFPIVILNNICKGFTNGQTPEICFSETYGLAPCVFNDDDMSKADTVLKDLINALDKHEDTKNELNVFYVACTRAMNRLYILAAEDPKEKKYDIASARNASKYSKLINFNLEEHPELLPIRHLDESLVKETSQTGEAGSAAEKDYGNTADGVTGYKANSVADAAGTGKGAGVTDTATTTANTTATATVQTAVRDYKYDSDIPFVSSASAMIKAAEAAAAAARDENAENDELPAEDSVVCMEEKDDFGKMDPDGNAADRGTAYHRFLELCDFSKKDTVDISKELDDYVATGEMSEYEVDHYLKGRVSELKDILRMDIFKVTEGAEDIRREQHFYCPVPASEFIDGKESDDTVIVQGALDLLVKKNGKWQIIDYKYSDKKPEALRRYYAAQIKVYRQVVSIITGQAMADIPATLVNIRDRYEVVI